MDRVLGLPFFSSPPTTGGPLTTCTSWMEIIRAREGRAGGHLDDDPHPPFRELILEVLRAQGRRESPIP